MAGISSQRTRLIVAGGLAVLLFAVLTWDSGSPEEIPPPRTARAVVSQQANPKGSVSGETDWPDVDPARAAELNPFDPDEAERLKQQAERDARKVQAPEPAAAQTDLLLEPDPDLPTPAERLRAAFGGQRLRMVYRSREGVVGLIGNRLVREGEVIEGLRIVSIRDDGLIVEPAPLAP